MGSVSKPEVTVAETARTLVNYSVDRDELAEILKGFPDDIEANRVAVEYELQLLKIISVGWALAYYANADPLRKALVEAYWQAIYEFSGQLSTVTSTTIGQELDYFQIVNERLNTYLSAISDLPQPAAAAAVIGHTFSGFCGEEGDPYAIIAGKKVFNFTIAGVKQYLESIQLIQADISSCPGEPSGTM